MKEEISTISYLSLFNNSTQTVCTVRTQNNLMFCFLIFFRKTFSSRSRLVFPSSFLFTFPFPL